MLILDEAATNINPFTDQQIQQVLNLTLRYSTIILIAHRRFIVNAADLIVVMHKGTIIGEEDHNTLLDHVDVMRRCTTPTSVISQWVADLIR